MVSQVNKENNSFGSTAWHRFRKDSLAMIGLGGVAAMLIIALLVPLLANNRPFFIMDGDGISFPFLRYLFAPDSSEIFIEQVFNYVLLFFIPANIIYFTLKKHVKIRNTLLIISALALLVPFFLTQRRLDKTCWRDEVVKNHSFAIFAPIPYGPYESVAEHYAKPSAKHLFGADQTGRDVLVRMLYGCAGFAGGGFVCDSAGVGDRDDNRHVRRLLPRTTGFIHYACGGNHNVFPDFPAPADSDVNAEG